jgi:probable FeS assembly SUF system protein SufT
MIAEEKIESPIDVDPTKESATVKEMQMVPEERVWDALRNCYDPEIPVNIVDLGLIYEVKMEEKIPGEADVYIKMTLTAPGCGMGPMIAADVKRRVQQIPGVTNVMVELVFDPMWNPDMMSESAKLALNMG